MSGIPDKRRKCHHGNSSNKCIHDLPACIFQLSAEFLPKTTKVLFAAAMQRHFDHVQISMEEGLQLVKNQKQMTESILKSKTPSVQDLLETIDDSAVNLSTPGVQKRFQRQVEYYYNAPNWEVLDLVDLGTTVASKLSDIDLLRILNCIGANERTKHLKLTNTHSIVGWGLAPLKTSSALEKMEFDTQSYDCSLEEDSVLPIIDAIMNTEGNSLKRFQFPPKWMDFNFDMMCFRPQPGDKLGRFLNNHKDTIALCPGSCCCHILPDGCDAHSLVLSLAEEEKFDDTDSCIWSNAGVHKAVALWHIPEPLSIRKVGCQHCNTIFCNENECHCSSGREYFYQCFECGQVSCKPCSRKSRNHSLNAVNGSCCRCDVTYCDRCRMELCQTGKLDCPECKASCFDLMQKSMRAQGLPWFDELCTTVESHLMRDNPEGIDFNCFEESDSNSM